MRRAWILLLAFVLPLQMTLAAASRCNCIGEGAKAALQAVTGYAVDHEQAAPQQNEGDSADSVNCDPHCSACHPSLAEASSIAGTATVQLPATPFRGQGGALKPVYIAEPERPNWRRFA